MLKIALIGAGGMASVHANCYARIAGAELAGIYDVRPSAAKSLAAARGVAAFDDFDDMLTSVRPDILDVCCPTPWHAEYVCRAANRAAEIGLRGISTEKPMARTEADCRRMIAACSGAGIPLFVAHVVRFFPEFALAKQQIENGAVGKPAAVRTRRGGPMPRAWNNWYADLELSGGCVLDLIIHDFDWLLWTFGPVERVFARGMGEQQLPLRDYALVTLRHTSGVISHVEGTWADPGGFKVAIEVAGDDGLLEYNFNQPAGAAFRTAIRDADDTPRGVALPENPLAVDPYEAELRHFVSCVAEGIEPSIRPEDGLEAVRVGLAALESIRTGEPIKL